MYYLATHEMERLRYMCLGKKQQILRAKSKQAFSPPVAIEEGWKRKHKKLLLLPRGAKRFKK